jgi:lysophospholipase L1-like esterase
MHHKSFQSPYFQKNPTGFNPYSSHSDEKLEFNFIHQFNHLGYRDDVDDKKKFKYFILGDSFVQGVGTDKDHTFDKLIEKQLVCDNCILNAGISGSNAIYHFKLLKKLIDEGYSTNNVILNINSSDILDILFKEKLHRQLENKGRSVIFQFIYGYSFVFRHFAHSVLQYNYRLLNKQENAEITPKITKVIYNKLNEYQKFCESRNMKFIIVFQPSLFECLTNTFDLQELINLIKKDNKLSYINMNRVFSKDCESYYWPHDTHFNTKGYVLYSQILFNELLLMTPSSVK